ncbi:unnamed protein product [Diatraea saccharalis]|uniref:Uncharacterized protein n=1 Tax=Diatraea saccharalis TaxID=40085 RepID=A0A9N9QWM5_9NEOP|nr:unnamed protein product [Diatraea saccharalis]
MDGVCGFASVIDIDKKEDINSHKKKTKVFILGDEHIKLLSEKLCKSRKHLHDDPYTITIMVKQGASCSQVLSSCDELKHSLSANDIVILSLGANDRNPYFLLSQLNIALHKLRHFKVYVTNVYLNRCLNTRLLNYNIKLLTQNFDNCMFLELNNDCYKTNRTLYLNDLCFKINIELDYFLYKSRYLEPHKIKEFLSRKYATQFRSQEIKIGKKIVQKKLLSIFLILKTKIMINLFFLG